MARTRRSSGAPSSASAMRSASSSIAAPTCHVSRAPQWRLGASLARCLRTGWHAQTAVAVGARAAARAKVRERVGEARGGVRHDARRTVRIDQHAFDGLSRTINAQH